MAFRIEYWQLMLALAAGVADLPLACSAACPLLVGGMGFVAGRAVGMG
jgi:hypothetical protein